jgi:DinB superfamily
VIAVIARDREAAKLVWHRRPGGGTDFQLPILAFSAILAIPMNPFSAIASDLGRTVAQAKPLLLKLDNADTTARPSANKWAKKEILGHLLDSASNNHQRFVRATLQGSLTFPGYDQNALVDLQRFADVDWNFLVDFWASYNRFLAHVINSLPAEAAAITCNIGNNPQATLEWLARDYVEYLKHHLNQVLGQTFPTNYGVKP